MTMTIPAHQELDPIPRPRRRIVIVDDDPALLGTAAALLERAGFEVFTCLTTFNRLNFIMEHKPDLVLLDVNMPMVTGDEIYRLMQDHARLRDYPVVFFSSNEEGELRRLVNRTGARGFISKSEVGSNFASKITRILDRIKGAPVETARSWPLS
jgi:DNA-binding response OmpR family regulator